MVARDALLISTHILQKRAVAADLLVASGQLGKTKRIDGYGRNHPRRNPSQVATPS